MSLVRGAAERFAVWREGNRHDWLCSYEDIATVTQLTISRVKIICIAAGWRCQEHVEGVDAALNQL